jgi:hypothetical protein
VRVIRRAPALVVLAVAMVGLSACSSGSSGGSVASDPRATTVDPAAADLRLNQVQVLGMHNAYHVEPSPESLAKLVAISAEAGTLAYSHDALDQQFEHQGIRQVELDITQDPTGQKFRPLGTVGSKVFHIEVIDEGSTCLTLVECLGVVKAWSDAHPDAMPLGIQLEIKDNRALTPAEFDSIDAEIRSVLPPDRLITPDDVRGGAATLEQAVLTTGWPRLADSRGKVIVVLDNREEEYSAGGHPSLEGRVAFAPSTPGKPDAAFLKENDPSGANLARIQDEVRKGYLVRTRADSEVTTPTSGDTTQREGALASGAQWVSTDYPLPGMASRYNGSTYVASIPGGTPARCNPINAPAGCESSWIENSPIPPSATVTTGTTR